MPFDRMWLHGRIGKVSYSRRSGRRSRLCSVATNFMYTGLYFDFVVFLKYDLKSTGFNEANTITSQISSESYKSGSKINQPSN